MRPIFVFFFSSRRRHTRLTCDWSSDVCSSDLSPAPAQSAGVSHAATAARALGSDWIDLGPLDDLPEGRPEIGRASCRERGEISVVGGSLKKKKEKFEGPTQPAQAKPRPRTRRS